MTFLSLLASWIDVSLRGRMCNCIFSFYVTSIYYVQKEIHWGTIHLSCIIYSIQHNVTLGLRGALPPNQGFRTSGKKVWRSLRLWFIVLKFCAKFSLPGPSPPVVTGMGHCPHMAAKNRMILAAQLRGTSQQKAGRLIGSCLNRPYVYVCMWL